MERFAVIGLGRFGMRLARSLADAGAEVIAVDRNREWVQEAKDDVALAVCLDATDEHALRSQGIDKVDVAVVGIGTNFEDAVLATATLKQIGVPRVLSRATTTTRGRILTSVGADDIVNPERESAERWCSKLVAPAVLERSVFAEGYSLVQVEAPPSFHGKTLKALAVGSRYRVLVVAIRRTVSETDEDGKETTHPNVVPAPGPDTAVVEGDILVLIGADEAIEAFPTG